jgi:hypothetical protein
MAKKPVRIAAVAAAGFLVQAAFQAAIALGRSLRRATPDGPPAEPPPAGPGSRRPGAHALPQRIMPEPGKARREVGDRLGPGCAEIEGGPGLRESARRPSRGSGRVTWTTSIVAAARSGSPWLGRRSASSGSPQRSRGSLGLRRRAA